ncbi:hypothetical protein [Frigoriglobus tundricola]|uniref:Uncharacterized protein n=1 Tax=Frigoriglobus tundricola TaxID=2774151 RepID=A0A6M5YTB7_9BACT|nr:hypothetical protein [Frigoriglobus tundricola]QJW96182.1 hypothetical protein FTUN_3738 [Frigoriglobus tundricola]
MFYSVTRTCLLLCVAAFTISVGSGQPLDGNKEGPKLRTVRPTYTAFPDLKSRNWSEIKDGKAAPVPPAPAIAADAPPLLKVRYEQFQEGLAFQDRVEEIIRLGVYDSRSFREYLSMTTETYRLAAGLEEKPAKRVPWYETRVVRLKEFEKFIEMRVQNGFDPPQNLHAARFSRLQAEADLLQLKAEVEKAAK